MDFLVNSIGDVFAWVFLLGSAASGLFLLAALVAIVRLGPMGAVLVASGAIFAALVALLGLAGDYVQRIYRQSSGRPFYLVRHVYASPAVEEHA
jgi:membrane associated rhomboid family serine protease